jgi:voltage-gated potassium channel
MKPSNTLSTQNTMTPVPPLHKHSISIFAPRLHFINRERMKKLGANVVIRPFRAYPELLVRSLVATGTEEVLENLFIHEGDHMIRLNFFFNEKVWADIVCRFVTADAGIPMAYVNETSVHVNPPPNTTCSGTGIILLIKATQHVTVKDAEKCLL